MPYLQNEIARAGALFDVAQQELDQSQQQLAALNQQSDTAQTQRTAAQTQLAALQPLVAERDQKQTQLWQLDLEEMDHTSQAASFGQSAAAARALANQARTQLTELQSLASQIPNLQAQVAQRSSVVADRNAELAAHDSIPSGERDADWSRVRAGLVHARQAAVTAYDNANAALADAQNRVAAIPALQQTIASSDASAASFDAQQASELAAAAAVRNLADPIRTRLAELNTQLSQIPILQELILSTTTTIDRLNGEIPAQQGVVSSAQARVEAAGVPLNELVALADEVARSPMNRLALEQVAATLGARLHALQAAQAAARTRHADATRRGEVVTSVRDQRQGELNTIGASITSVQNSVNSLIAQGNTATSDLQTKQTTLASISQQITSHKQNKPAGTIKDDDWRVQLREWWTALEELQLSYQSQLGLVLTARQGLVLLGVARDEAQAQLQALQDQASQLQAAIADLNQQRDALTVAAQTAESDAAGLEPSIGEFRVARETATARLLGMAHNDLPILFFPVRIETRFATSNAGNELLVRVYPDDIHVDTHEPELTAEEHTWGDHFWQATTTAGNDDDEKRAAWQQLALRFGPARAAWIARSLDPAQGAPVSSRSSSWTRAPYSQVVPDRWVVIGYRAGQVDLTAWSGPCVPDPLPMGLSPQGVSGSTNPFEDPGIAWMTEFTAALQAGMALRVSITPEQAHDGFDRLVVLGVKAFLAGKDEWLPADAQEATARLARLIDAHHYTQGLALVSQSTPTNNTRLQPSGYSTEDPLGEEAYVVERGAALVQPGDGSDGAFMAAMLGLDPAVFAHVRHADGGEQRDAQTANSALWPVFQSFFLEALLAAPTSTAARDHFVSFVRARGPVPALRVGNQPYGVLPVTSLERWVPQPDGEDATLVPRLRDLWSTWRLNGERAAHSGQQADVSKLLLQQPGASRYTINGLGGIERRGELAVDHVDAPFAASLGALANRPLATRQALVAETLDLGSFRLDAWAVSVATRRLIQLRATRPTGIHLGGYGWIENLRPASPRTNKGYVHAPSLPQAATAAVLRSGYLAHRVNGQGDALAVDLSSDRVHRARWILDGVREGQSLGALLGYRFERALHDHHLDHLIAPFRILAGLVEDEPLAMATRVEQEKQALHRQMQARVEMLEEQLASAELVLLAVQTQLVQLTGERDQRRSQLAQLTASQTTVTNCQAALATIEQSIIDHQANRPRSRVNRPGNLDEDTNPDQDVYLPNEDTVEDWQATLRSLQTQKQQAVAARDEAIRLRDSLAGGSNRYDIALNALNSDIARLDQEIAAQQNPIGDAQAEVARLESELNGANQDAQDAHAAWIAAGQALQSLLHERWLQVSESVAAHHVVDGLELQRRWRLAAREQEVRWDWTTIPWNDADLGLPPVGTAEHQGVVEQLTALDEMVDAVSDTLIAEGVFQLVQGNTVRAGATLETIATGKTVPPELEVVRTPRTGIALNHRVLALASAVHPSTPPWGANLENPRAVAEPCLNAWIKQLLVDPVSVWYSVEILDPASGQVLHQGMVSLSVLGLSPLDALYLAESRGNSQQSELEQRLVYHTLRTRPAHIPANAGVRLDLRRALDWPASAVSVVEFMENVRAVRAFVTNARAVDARDLALPGQAFAPGVNVTELQTRANSAVQALQQAYQALLDAHLATGSVVESLRAALMRLADFGIEGAVPFDAAGQGWQAQEILEQQARVIEQEAERRLGQLQQHDTASPGVDVASQRDFQVRRLQIIFGESFRVLPQITLVEANTLTQAFDENRWPGGSDPLTVVTWFQQISQVRENIGRFHAVLTFAEALETGADLTLRVGQLPYVGDDRWVGLAATPDHPIPPGRLSLVAYLPGGFQFSQAAAGLLVDEWVEVVPNGKEVTGVAFHYNQPNARAPQSLLLAIPPDLRPERTPVGWDLDTLATTLRETWDLTRVRLASPEHLGGTLWHTFRRANGTWGPFDNVDEAAARQEAWQALAIAGVNESLHVLGTAGDGSLWHTSRTGDGAWLAFRNVVGDVGNRGALRDVACAGDGNTLHVCAIGTTGLWHTIRFADGTWQPFVNVEEQTGRRGVPRRIACAVIGQEMHVCLVTQDGKLWHTIRRSDGSWFPFGDVEGQAGDRSHFLSVCCAAVNGVLHVCGTSTTGLWHTVRWADGSWSLFGDVLEQTGVRGYVEDVACAGIGEEFHLRILTGDARVWHTTRYVNGAWSPFREIAGLGYARRVACASIGMSLHLCDVGASPLPTTLYFASGSIDLNALPVSG